MGGLPLAALPRAFQDEVEAAGERLFLERATSEHARYRQLLEARGLGDGLEAPPTSAASKHGVYVRVPAGRVLDSVRAIAGDAVGRARAQLGVAAYPAWFRPLAPAEAAVKQLADSYDGTLEDVFLDDWPHGLLGAVQTRVDPLATLFNTYLSRDPGSLLATAAHEVSHVKQFRDGVADRDADEAMALSFESRFMEHHYPGMRYFRTPDPSTR